MLQRDASIHRFEFTFELAWKAIQAVLKRESIEAMSPRECLDHAWRQGWIDEEEHWLKMLGDRNLCSHIYKESMAEEVYSRLGEHLEELRKLAEKLAKL